MKVRYFKKVLHSSVNWRLNANGGDYDEYVVVATNENGETVAGKFASSADFDMCRGCGRYMSMIDSHECLSYQGPLHDGSQEWEEVRVSSLHLFLPV